MSSESKIVKVQKMMDNAESEDYRTTRNENENMITFENKLRGMKDVLLPHICLREEEAVKP